MVLTCSEMINAPRKTRLVCSQFNLHVLSGESVFRGRDKLLQALPENYEPAKKQNEKCRAIQYAKFYIAFYCVIREGGVFRQ